MKNGNGNVKANKINLYDENWFPKIADLTRNMTETEKKAIEEIVSKNPDETWEVTAKKVGITVRQLFNIRQDEKVQEACYTITKDLFKSDLPDVLKKLTEKAKRGEAWAVKLYLEVAGELKDGQNNGKDNPQGHNSTPDLRENGLKLLEKFKLMSDEELTQSLLDTIKLPPKW